jgi:hypothetical protein
MIRKKVYSLQFTVYRILFFLFALHCLLFSACYAQPVSSTELIQNAQEYDAREVVYEGEVIGEVMLRKQGAWVNINDGENSIGVWMPLELAKTIKYQGGYKAKGDIVQVRGIFNRACVQHGGDLDIHALSLLKIKSGWLKPEKIIPAKRNLLAVLIVILCLILILKISLIR